MHNKTIILVENNLPMQNLYQRELSRNFHVLVFSDVPGVLEAMEVLPISAVVLEVELPSGKGWSLLETIKQTTNVPVILFSTLDVRKKALHARADAFLLKPVPPTALNDTVVQICGLNPISYYPKLKKEMKNGKR